MLPVMPDGVARVDDAPVPVAFVESAFDAGTLYSRRLASGGEMAHAYLTAARPYAPLALGPDLSTSPYRADLLCRCGSKNADNACISNTSSVTAPYALPSAGQLAWFSQLWAPEDPAPAPSLGRAELLLMARSGPQF